MSELPAYTTSDVLPTPLKHSMAGPIQTVCFEDMQHDYFRITYISNNPTTCEISLTVDPTPLYRVEFSSDPSAIADIQIFAAFTSGPPLAACRFPVKRKGDPVVNICSALPLSPSALWRPFYKSGSMTSIAYRENYYGSLPLVMIPGCSAAPRNFAWRINPGPHNEAHLELWLKDPLPYKTTEGIDRKQLFARYYGAGPAPQTGQRSFIEKRVLEVRRGCGIEFEFSALLGVFAIIELMKRN